MCAGRLGDVCGIILSSTGTELVIDQPAEEEEGEDSNDEGKDEDEAGWEDKDSKFSRTLIRAGQCRFMDVNSDTPADQHDAPRMWKRRAKTRRVTRSGICVNGRGF